MAPPRKQTDDLAGMTVAELADERERRRDALAEVERAIAGRHGEVDPTPETEG